VTNNKGAEPAMEWLLAHVDEDIPAPSGDAVLAPSADPTATAEANAESSASDAPGEAKSIKCDECNRLFKSQVEVEFHAAKSGNPRRYLQILRSLTNNLNPGHSSFSESTEEKKPLTEEEKKKQLALIEEKLKQKRVEREQQEKVEALEREKSRIKSGKDLTEVRRKMEEQEMQKILEQRKREKLEEKAARDRVRAKIEQDKLNRKMKADKEAGIVSPPAPVVAPVATITSSAPTKEYTTTRIQIRLQDGSSVVQEFNVKEQLAAVRLFIQMKIGETPFGLMTNFPKKVFSDEDYDIPLENLNLVPSAVLIVTKCHSM
jgi:UBX domain-containing protein 1/4